MPTVYITCPPAAAADLAETLVEERLVACVNAVDCASTYRWEGDVVTDEEQILFCKTADDRVDDLMDRVVELHPHDVPCIECFDVDTAHEPFAAWIDDATH